MKFVKFNRLINNKAKVIALMLVDNDGNLSLGNYFQIITREENA